MPKAIWEDPGLWAGLNRPDLEPGDADVVIFGIPFDGGVSFRAGAADAPDAIRSITYTISPTTEDFQSFAGMTVRDAGNLTGHSRNDLFDNAAAFTEALVRDGRFFIMLGGDHSVTIPVQKGVDRALNTPLGIVHLDAHFDLCHHQGGDRLSHGSTARRALDLDNIGGIEDIFFLGIRSIESDEVDFYKKNPLQVLSAKAISEIGARKAVQEVKNKLGHLEQIYLTLDIDCLDPAYAAGTGTPQFGGLTSRELLTLLEGLFDLPVIGMDIVEVAPGLDPSLASVFAARKIITEVLGFVSKRSTP